MCEVLAHYLVDNKWPMFISWIKRELRHTTIFKSFFFEQKNLFKQGNAELEVIRTPPTGAWGDFYAESVMLVAQSCPTLYDPMYWSPPGSSVLGILQARILEWLAIPFSRGPSDPGINPGSPALQAD